MTPLDISLCWKEEPRHVLGISVSVRILEGHLCRSIIRRLRIGTTRLLSTYNMKHPLHNRSVDFSDDGRHSATAIASICLVCNPRSPKFYPWLESIVLNFLPITVVLLIQRFLLRLFILAIISKFSKLYTTSILSNLKLPFRRCGVYCNRFLTGIKKEEKRCFILKKVVPPMVIESFSWLDQKCSFPF